MSISLPFLKGGATKPSVIEAVTTVLSRTAPKVALAPLCLKHDLQQIRSISSNALLASSLTSDEIASTNLFHSTLTHTSEAFIKNINVEYQNLAICLVRSIVSDPELCALRYRDRIDSLTGFNLNQEIAHVRKCMEHTVQCAIQEAKVHKSESITLVLKTVTRHEKINNLLQEIAEEKCAAAGIQLTVAHTAQVHNRLIMFPEQFRVLLANDVPASDHLDGVVLGLAGGNGITHQYLLGTQAKGFMGNGSSENPLSTLVAASEAMKHLGLHEESATTLKVLKNAISKESHRTKDLGGSMDAMSFAKVCVA